MARQSPVDAISGFLEPEMAHTSTEGLLSLANAGVQSDPTTTKIVEQLTDGQPHDSEQLRTAVDLPVLQFASAVGQLSEAKLVNVTSVAGKELVSLTDTGAKLLG